MSGFPVDGAEDEHVSVMFFGDLFRLADHIRPCGDHGNLVNNPLFRRVYTRISDKVVGILLRAKKYGLLYFEPEMLFQVGVCFCSVLILHFSSRKDFRRKVGFMQPFFFASRCRCLRVAGTARRRPRRHDEADARDLLRVQPKRQDLRHARRSSLGIRGRGPPAREEMTPEMDRQDSIPKRCWVTI